ncbi:ABC transporter permease [Streptococcus sp. 10F2]
MRNYFEAEWKKARKIQLLLIGMTFLIFSSFIGLGIYFSNKEVLIEGTQSLVLWGQLTFYNSTFLYSPMLAIIAGLLITPEFERKNLEMLKANQVSMWRMYIGKLLCGFIIVLPIQLVLLFIFIVAIRADGIILDLGLQTYLKWIFLSLIASISIITVQSYITVKTRSFSKSVGVAIVGSVLNFVLIFISEDLTKFFPYSQPMVALRSRALTDLNSSNLIIFLFVNLALSLLFYKLTVDVLEKTD